ncbi:MAG: ArgK/MeaB family GTPase, partial [Desulfotomaculales bacterium]
KEVVKAMDAFGFDWIMIETVGVGQAELDIMHVADSVVVVLTPGAGDSIQAIKAGIMEIADIFAVNKSDQPGAEKMALEIEMMLDLYTAEISWRPPVVKTSAVSGMGAEDLLAAIERHRRYILEKGSFQKKRAEQLRSETLEILDRKWQQLVRREMKLSEEVNRLLDSVARRELDPYTAASSILKRVMSGSVSGQEKQATVF